MGDDPFFASRDFHSPPEPIIGSGPYNPGHTPDWVRAMQRNRQRQSCRDAESQRDRSGRDFDSVLNEGAHTFALVVNYEMAAVPPGEAVFGDLSFGSGFVAEPWPEFAEWRLEWERAIFEFFNRKFDLKPRGRARLDCLLTLNHVQPGDSRHVHLRIRAAKGGRRPPAGTSDTPYQGVETAAGGTEQDVDMLLHQSDLSPRQPPGQSVHQTRALNQFGRYLGCWALSGGDRDLLSSGDELRPWHGWPWWRRYWDHIGQCACEVKLSLGSENAHVTEHSEGESPQEQQSSLREGESTFLGWTENDWIAFGATAVVIAAVVGPVLAVVIYAATEEESDVGRAVAPAIPDDD